MADFTFYIGRKPTNDWISPWSEFLLRKRYCTPNYIPPSSEAEYLLLKKEFSDTHATLEDYKIPIKP